MRKPVSMIMFMVLLISTFEVTFNDLQVEADSSFHAPEKESKIVRVIEHKVTAVELGKLKQEVGVWEQHIDYNKIINGYGTGRRRTTRVDGIFNVTTKDRYRLRLAVCALTLSRIKTSQEKAIRAIIKRIVEEKASTLEFDQFVQEAVLGKLASDIYNEAKKISPLRHVGVRKSKLILQPAIAA